jgi:hypothetical protein
MTAEDIEKDRLPVIEAEANGTDGANGTNGSSVQDVERIQTPAIVDWDSADDPKNPMNWSKQKKWSTIGLVAYITFVT